MSKRGERSQATYLQSPSIIYLWSLRLLILLSGHNHFIKKYGFSDEQLAEFLGVAHWNEDSDLNFNPRLIRQELSDSLKQAEKNLHQYAVSTLLAKNVARLSQLVGLSEADCRIIEFVAMIQNYPLLEAAGDTLESIATPQAIRSLSVVLKLLEENIRHSLSPNGMLIKSGLIYLSRQTAAKAMTYTLLKVLNGENNNSPPVSIPKIFFKLFG